MNQNIENFPQRIVCLTEEPVEILYALGVESRIVGVSSFVQRPIEAKRLPEVTSFIKTNYSLLKELNPDLILGYSDVQKEIARDLVDQGYNVFISNHRSIEDIFSYTMFLARVIGKESEGHHLLSDIKGNLEKIKERFSKSKKLKVYFEEWDEPLISCSRWICQLLEIFNIEVFFSNESKNKKSLERSPSLKEVVNFNPDLILACWCGKKVDLSSFKRRDGFETINAVKNDCIYELDPAIFLQPGLAPLTSGIDVIKKILNSLPS